MTNKIIETGAIPLDSFGDSISWRRDTRTDEECRVFQRTPPGVCVMYSASETETIFRSAQSLAVYGTENLKALRSAINKALGEE